MKEEKVLDEGKYQKNKKVLNGIGIAIILIGLIIGGFFIVNGLNKVNAVNEKYSASNIQKVSDELDAETKKLEARKAELESNGVKYYFWATYTYKDAYELKLITELLYPGSNDCIWDAYKNSDATAKYCSLK